MKMNSLEMLFALSICMVCFGCAGHAAPQDPTKMPTTFQECVDQGGKILKSYPAQCVAPNGIRFFQDEFQPKGQDGVACKDLCGNGKCEEIVCMAVGCPCPETATSCPKDCAGE
jgi:hypothetical protein